MWFFLLPFYQKGGTEKENTFIFLINKKNNSNKQTFLETLFLLASLQVSYLAWFDTFDISVTLNKYILCPRSSMSKCSIFLISMKYMASVEIQILQYNNICNWVNRGCLPKVFLEMYPRYLPFLGCISFTYSASLTRCCDKHKQKM